MLHRTRSGAQRELPLALDSRPRSPYVYAAITPAKPTKIVDAYWRFAAERQRIFFRRVRKAGLPWTEDPILRKFRFTNAYRASDRVSQYLIRKVIYTGSTDPHEVFFRTLLFKIFNRIETWELLRDNLGEPSWKTFQFATYDAVLTRAFRSGQKIYSAAYIMPSPHKFPGHRKHTKHLGLLSKMMKNGLPEQVLGAPRMEAAYQQLLRVPSLGPFLAYQFVIDLNYSACADFSEQEFVVPGPGALEGIEKCFSDLGGLSPSDIIRLMMDRQREEFERLGLEFQDLWGRPLQLVDCQSLFCEVAKYTRVAHPEYSAESGRTRIKQLYRRQRGHECPWYPPKWNLNDLVGRECRAGSADE